MAEDYWEKYKDELAEADEDELITEFHYWKDSVRVWKLKQQSSIYKEEQLLRVVVDQALSDAEMSLSLYKAEIKKRSSSR